MESVYMRIPNSFHKSGDSALFVVFVSAVNKNQVAPFFHNQVRSETLKVCTFYVMNNLNEYNKAFV